MLHGVFISIYALKHVKQNLFLLLPLLIISYKIMYNKEKIMMLFRKNEKILKMGGVDMKFLPVLSELFSSDSIIFMIIGFVIAVIISMKISDKRKGVVGMAAGLSVYAVCEIILNIRTNNVLEIGLLFAGTVALGLCLGFLIGTVLLKGKYL